MALEIQILSPDGFTFDRDMKPFRSYKKAYAAMIAFVDRFRGQGYYRDNRWNQIDVVDIPANCIVRVYVDKKLLSDISNGQQLINYYENKKPNKLIKNHVKNMSAIIYRIDGTSNAVVPVNGTDFQLDELRAHLNCQWIECVPLHDGRLMLIDEEGKLAGDLHVNVKATAMFMIGRRSVDIQDAFEAYKKRGFEIISVPHDHALIDDVIVGDAIVCSPDMFR